MGKAKIVAVVGAGGKTSFIQRAEELSLLQGKKTAVMTTTHMWIPPIRCAVGKHVLEAAGQMERDGSVYFGGCAREEGKMSFPGQNDYEELCRRAEWVFVEADGSKGLPMKIPDWRYEPVIPNNTDSIIVVFGLSALGNPLGQVCHRWERAETFFKDCLVTKEMAVRIVEEAYLKPVRLRFPYSPLTLILNQADTDKRESEGNQIRQSLQKRGWDVQVMQLKPISLSVIYMASGFSKRFGKNKLLENWKGKPLYHYGLDVFLNWKAKLEKKKRIRLELILVSQYPEILEEGRRRGICTVENPSASEGITSSIRLGIGAAKENTDYYLFSVADQPGLSVQTMEGFAEAFFSQIQENCTNAKTIACLSAQGKPGNPVIFHRRFKEELLALTGDKGGSQIIRRYPEKLLCYPVEKKEVMDIDVPEDCL